ncbi:GMP/IMP nucleotidase [Solemya velesiana gill symbiont]|uniref:Haloacid dehalogenase n=1 Tax=Solemya velesiana gill symbiont TaxID=1918948 RepID=A0A1T2KW94_9GAMM|nr:GMP/IMP nucleotidase [Solemya velesiana gill symbiont]OOZ37128.1 haloacid dehalogenase [Solemya velesiana gill symbiont]
MIDWNQIDSVFLDMDGTLLDLHFDNHFWLKHVPKRYAQERMVSIEQAKRQLMELYKSIEGTLEWYCVDHWSRKLGLDIALLKEEVDHLISVHPHVVDFLDAARGAGKRVVLVTNAHQKSLDLKLRRTRLGGHFDKVICAHDLGLPKEDIQFWDKLQKVEPFDKARTLFVDDSPSVLASARAYGIDWLLAVLRPDTKAPPREAGEFDAIHDFSEILSGL